MTTRLHPSFLRAAASTLVLFTALTAATYLWQGYHDHHWWTRGYIFSLLIPFAILPLFICLAWVPTRFEFSETHLTVQFPFRSLETVAWDDLEYFGWFEGVYGMRFHTAGTLTFYPQAFPRREWRMLKAFLCTAFPERKGSGFIGSRLFQWPRKKT